MGTMVGLAGVWVLLRESRPWLAGLGLAVALIAYPAGVVLERRGAWRLPGGPVGLVALTAGVTFASILLVG